jgi:hypothetical protein
LAPRLQKNQDFIFWIASYPFMQFVPNVSAPYYQPKFLKSPFVEGWGTVLPSSWLICAFLNLLIGVHKKTTFSSLFSAHFDGF